MISNDSTKNIELFKYQFSKNHQINKMHGAYVGYTSKPGQKMYQNYYTKNYYTRLAPPDIQYEKRNQYWENSYDGHRFMNGI